MLTYRCFNISRVKIYVIWKDSSTFIWAYLRIFVDIRLKTFIEMWKNRCIHLYIGGNFPRVNLFFKYNQHLIVYDNDNDRLLIILYRVVWDLNFKLFVETCIYNIVCGKKYSIQQVNLKLTVLKYNKT